MLEEADFPQVPVVQVPEAQVLPELVEVLVSAVAGRGAGGSEIAAFTGRTLAVQVTSSVACVGATFSPGRAMRYDLAGRATVEDGDWAAAKALNASTPTAAAMNR